MGNSNRKSNFVKNLKDEIRRILRDDDPSGNVGKGQEDLIKTVANKLRKGKRSGEKAQEAKQIKAQESLILKQFALENNLWIEDILEADFLDEGAEQRVYFSGANVLKVNSGIYYESWEDYLISLQIHNFLFPNTAYTLKGFTESKDNFCIVVEQPYVKSTEDYNLDEIKILLTGNGFRNIKNQDFIHDELGLIVEDLHDENVLKQDGIYFIIDSAIYLKDKNIFMETTS